MGNRGMIAVGVGAAMFLAACSNGDVDGTPPEGVDTGAHAEVPEGWTTHEQDGVALAHPPDWEVREEDDGRVTIAGPEGGDLAPIVSVRWAAPVGLSPMESLQSATGNVVTTMPDVEPGDAETFETAGGHAAARRLLEYTQPLQDGEIPVVELQAIVLGDTLEVLVRAVHRADEFDRVEATFEDIVASIDIG